MVASWELLILQFPLYGAAFKDDLEVSAGLECNGLRNNGYNLSLPCNIIPSGAAIIVSGVWVAIQDADFTSKSLYGIDLGVFGTAFFGKNLSF